MQRLIIVIITLWTGVGAASTFSTPVITTRDGSHAYTTSTILKSNAPTNVHCEAVYANPDGKGSLRATYDVRPGATVVERETLSQLQTESTLGFNCTGSVEAFTIVTLRDVRTGTDASQRVFPAATQVDLVPPAGLQRQVDPRGALMLIEIAGRPVSVEIVARSDAGVGTRRQYELPPFGSKIVEFAPGAGPSSIELRASGEGAAAVVPQLLPRTTVTPSPAETALRDVTVGRFKAAPFVDPATNLAYFRQRWYDGVSQTFLAPDAMGYEDSSNLYAYTAGDPVNGSDPTGLYEEDVHRHLTVFLALKAGFNFTAALRIGAETEALDLDARDAMYGGGANNANMISYHFVSPRRLLDMRHQALTGSVLNDQSFRAIGEFLHAWEDSYSHQESPDRRDFQQQYHDKHPVTRQDIGHGRHKHRPDWTWDRSKLTLQMAEATYNQLVALCAPYRDQCKGTPQPFSTFRSQVERFAEFEPALYNDVYPAAIDITVPDVASYEAKVRILGLTTLGTPEAARRAARVAASEARGKPQK